MSSLSGKVALVTGASSGLGRAIAVAMAEKGAWLALHGRDKDKLDAVQATCGQVSGGHPERFLAVRGDVTSRDDRKEIIQAAMDKFGRLDVLVANAGISSPGQDIASGSEETFDTIMDTNLKSVLFLIQTAIPHLEKTKGTIVCMSSLYGHMPTAVSSFYSISKAALEHMIRCLALSLGPKGIRINGIKPSFIPTDILRGFPNAADTTFAFSTREAPHHLVGGRCGTPEEIASAAVFLASEESSFIIGENICVDGGRRFFPA